MNTVRPASDTEHAHANGAPYFEELPFGDGSVLVTLYNITTEVNGRIIRHSPKGMMAASAEHVEATKGRIRTMVKEKLGIEM